MRKLLLDSHTVLWWLAKAPQLSGAAQEAIGDRTGEVWYSCVTLWELGIKISLGKLSLNQDLLAVADTLQRNTVQCLSLEPRHCQALVLLPFHHRDPFDRMLVAQALTTDMTLVSRDSQLDAYGVKRLW